MESLLKKLQTFAEQFKTSSIPEDFTDIVKNEFGINLQSKYGSYPIKNPLLVAPGQLTTSAGQIVKIKNAGYAGCVLKSVVGEDEKGASSMSHLRKRPTYIKTVYDPDDKEGAYPIIHWDGGLDLRNFSQYLAFAEEARQYSDDNFLLVTSILCHLPLPDEEFKKEEWVYTAKTLYNLGYKIFEIDFCPQLQKSNALIDKENILRWYKTIPLLVKSVSSEISVYPKLMNLDFGLGFQVQMVEASIKGKADGVVVANRIYKKEYGCAHGGKELRKGNLEQVKEIKKTFPEISTSATGGIYSGRHVFDYLCAGAENVQLLSHIMGKVRKPFIKRIGNKFEQVFYQLILDPKDGFLACKIREK
jgi:dihydroorotate dehydrogenase